MKRAYEMNLKPTKYKIMIEYDCVDVISCHEQNKEKKTENNAREEEEKKSYKYKYIMLIFFAVEK